MDMKNKIIKLLAAGFALCGMANAQAQSALEEILDSGVLKGWNHRGLEPDVGS